MKGPFGSVIMTRLNFKVKTMFLLQNWGACVDTRFWHVSRRRVAEDKRFCIVRSADLEGRSVSTVKDVADRRGENQSDILTSVWQELSYF